MIMSYRSWRWHVTDIALSRRTVFPQFYGPHKLKSANILQAHSAALSLFSRTNDSRKIVHNASFRFVLVASAGGASASSPPSPSPGDDLQPTPFLEDLLIPFSWTSADIAAQEAEWLRVNLHQWLDDEYCPEPANDEISRRCARVYYYCLLERQRDMGDILMQMVRELETFSFKESFHGAFSSANAAIDLITKKIRRLEEKN
ncbi:hypothetical protein KP509_29G023200 [Ceratopteris richardii]|uniref:Uncharacterized protein n=1 Tax=Ceratopteris richardii TaxID=49495 RepID=A0A8T2R6L6_CERRI|nr:hypothetical protein KP509_29G023200 [Ceratopteris richardii]